MKPVLADVSLCCIAVCGALCVAAVYVAAYVAHELALRAAVCVAMYFNIIFCIPLQCLCWRMCKGARFFSK